jgi:hypothetical protein
LLESLRLRQHRAPTNAISRSMKRRASRKAAAQGAKETSQTAPISRRTLRVTFEYEGNQFRIVNLMRVAKITPPSLAARPEAGAAAGYWVELRDKRGRCLFHRLLPDAIRDSAEIYPEKGPLLRTPLREVKGRFEVLLPDLPEADTIVILGHPITREGLKLHARTGVLAKFDIGKERQAQ